MGKRLFVGNLSFDVNEAELRDLFAQSGTVADCKLVTDRDTGRPRGFGFVEMSSEAEANAAIENLNGRDHPGRTPDAQRAPGRPRGCGFGEMSGEAEANAAIENLNGRDYQGRTLNVNEAQERS